MILDRYANDLEMYNRGHLEIMRASIIILLALLSLFFGRVRESG